MAWEKEDDEGSKWLNFLKENFLKEEVSKDEVSESFLKSSGLMPGFGGDNFPDGVAEEELKKIYKLYQINLVRQLQPDNGDDLSISTEIRRNLAAMDNEEMSKFCKFIGDRVEEEEKAEVSMQNFSSEIKECFGQAELCHNCQSLRIELDPNSKVKEILKRCGRCHLVAYCSERCQKEHWLNNHKAKCKILSKKTKQLAEIHKPTNCTMCMMRQSWHESSKVKKRAGVVLDNECPSSVAQKQLMEFYWSEFGYHRNSSCQCSEDDIQKMIDNKAYPMQIPFEMGEILKGDFIDWIDNFLGVLYFLLSAVETEFGKDISKLKLETHFKRTAVYIIKMRAKYWYLITNEKYRYITTHLFSLEVIKLSEQMQLGELKTLYHMDEALHKSDDEHEQGLRIWEIFLFRLGSFYRLLRLTHHQLYNINSIPKHKQKDFAYFKNVHDLALKNLGDGVAFLTTDSGFFIDHYFEPLMADVNWCKYYKRSEYGEKCCACNTNLNRMLVQYAVQVPENVLSWRLPQYEHQATTFGYLFPDHLSQIRFRGKPIKAEMWDSDSKISCGNMEQGCNDILAQYQRSNCEKVVKAHVNFLFFSQKCHGCLKLCLESHKCSGCRAVRYCSKECLEVDWKVHKEYCQEDLLLGVENLSLRQLSDDQKNNFFKTCTQWLGKCEPIFKVIITSWKETNLCMDQIIKYKKKKENKKTSNGEAEKPKDLNKENQQHINSDKKSKKREKQNKKETRDMPEEEENIGATIKVTDCRTMTEYEFPNDDEGMKNLKVVMISTNLGKVPQIVSALLKHKYNAREVSDDKPKNNCDKEKQESLKREKELQKKDLSSEHTCCGMCGKDMDEKAECKANKENGNKFREKSLAEEVKSKVENCNKETVNKFKEDCISEEKSLPKKQQEINIKPENLDKVMKIIEHNRMGHLNERHFEIRHLKKQAALNEKVCKVVDASIKTDIFDPRVVVQLKGDERLVSLKQTNLVDICADIEDIKDTPCIEGHIFRSCDKPLKPSYVTKMLKKVISWAKEPGNEQDRPDQLYRLNLVLKYINGEIEEFLCKDNPDYTKIPSLSKDEVFSATLAAVRPGCVGDTKVDFSRFNHLVCSCDKQLTKRFREYIITGMCHACQAYYIERKETEQKEQYGSVYIMCTRVKSIDGLRTLVD